jgi:hypothetical protein
MDQTSIAIAQNAASNGRLFSAGIAAVDAYAGHPVLALAAILPVGVASLLDAVVPLSNPSRPAISMAVYGFSAAVWVASFITLW